MPQWKWVMMITLLRGQNHLTPNFRGVNGHNFHGNENF
jgi:hypothetical protein